MGPSRYCLPVFALTVALVGCMVHDVDTDPKPPVTISDGWRSDGGVAVLTDRWWSGFGDAVLDSLVEQGLMDNLDLRQAWARLDQATARSRTSRVGLFPHIDGSVTAGGSGMPFASDPVAPAVEVGGQPITIDIPSPDKHKADYGLSIDVGYEVDLWGRVRAAMEAGDSAVDASREDLQTVAMSIAGGISETWFALRTQRSTDALLQRQLQASRELAELVQLRFDQGLASALDVYQQRQQVAAIEAQAPLVTQGVALLEHRLAVLVGTSPGTLDVPAVTGLPDLPPLPEVGVPATLLQRRPDVRAAHHRVVAADYQLAVAVADQFPALRIGGRAGFSTHDLADILTGFLWSLVANIMAPIFDGGRRSAEVERQRAVVQEVLAGYGKVVLGAIQEVEDALITEHTQALHLARLREQQALATATLREAKRRYLNGLIAYLPVLTALGSLQKIDQAVLGARQKLLSNRVRLFKALGGSWDDLLSRRSGGDEVETSNTEGGGS